MTSTGAQAVDRAAQLLALVVQADGPISFTELVDDAGLARSTTSRLLAALEANHLLERDAGGAYRCGALFAYYAARHDPWSQVARLARPVLEAVGAATGETVNLAVPRGETVVQIAQVDSTFMLRARDWTRIDVPPHCSALGKVLYAFAGLPLPTGPLEQRTEHSIGTLAELRRDLDTVRSEGWAVTRGELEIGLDGVAVPVFREDGTVLAALGVSGPSARMTDDLTELGRVLTDHATSLSHLLRPRIRTKGVA